MRKQLTGVGVCASIAALMLGASPAQAATPTELAPLRLAPTGGLTDSYVVSLDEGADPVAVADDLGVPLGRTFSYLINGFTTTVDSPKLYQARANGAVRSISQIRSYRAEPASEAESASEMAPTSQVEPRSWGLDRINQAKLPLDGNLASKYNGKGVTAYLIDSGIAPKHPGFGGRASIGFDATGGDGFDGNSHGTHVAGIVGSRDHGVAKQSRLVGVKVLADDGTGTTGDILAGMEWVARNAQGPSVANMSLSGPKDPTLNEAAHKLVTKAGVFLAAAAGDWAGDAHEVSPASANGVLTVAASNRRDEAADSSNHGATIELYAPGVEIPSTIPNDGARIRSGTSQATAFVGGAAALFLQAHPRAKPVDILRGLRSRSSKNVVRDVPEETIRDLLWLAGP